MAVAATATARPNKANGIEAAVPPSVAFGPLDYFLPLPHPEAGRHQQGGCQSSAVDLETVITISRVIIPFSDYSSLKDSSSRRQKKSTTIYKTHTLKSPFSFRKHEDLLLRRIAGGDLSRGGSTHNFEPPVLWPPSSTLISVSLIGL